MYKEVNGELEKIGYSKEEFICARKLSKGYLLVDHKTLEGKDESSLELIKHISNSYSGKGTRSLDYRVNKKYKEAIIYPGIKPEKFNI